MDTIPQIIPEGTVRSESAMSSTAPPPAEYLAHPVLHQFILEADNSFEMVRDTAIADFYIEEGGLTNFYFSGEMTQKRKAAKKGLQFYLFSNQLEDYENFSPIASIPIKGQKVAKGQYQYEIRENFELEPAMYYYIIRDRGGAQNYYIGYFSVIIQQ